MGCSPWGRWGSDTTERLHFHFSVSCIGEGNGNPLQWSCLENSRDGGAWWAAVYGVAQSQTWLKRLSSSSSSIKDATKHSSTYCPGDGPFKQGPACILAFSLPISSLKTAGIRIILILHVRTSWLREAKWVVEALTLKSAWSLTPKSAWKPFTYAL